MADKSNSPTIALLPKAASPTMEIVRKPAKVKNSQAKPNHPSTAEMVNVAIRSLAERNGSSLQAIKKYMAANYKLNTEKHAIFIKRYLKSAVTAGTLVQTKGKGASGSFKIAVKKAQALKGKPEPRSVAAKTDGSPKKTATKKLVGKKADASKLKTKKEALPRKEKKPVGEKKAVKPKVEKTVASKSPKEKKIAKGPTAKPKAPKPKKATAPKAKAAPKKATVAKQ